MKNLVPIESISTGGKFSDLDVKGEFNREDRIKCSSGDGIISKDYDKAFDDVYEKKISVKDYVERKTKEVHGKVAEWLKARVLYNFKIESFIDDFYSIKVIVDCNSECFKKDQLLKDKVKDEMWDLMEKCEKEILSDEFVGFIICPTIETINK